MPPSLCTDRISMRLTASVLVFRLWRLPEPHPPINRFPRVLRNHQAGALAPDILGRIPELRRLPLCLTLVTLIRPLQQNHAGVEFVIGKLCDGITKKVLGVAFLEMLEIIENLPLLGGKLWSTGQGP